MHDRIVAFPDTNIFLHFKPFDEIPWAKELGGRSVCLRITQTVIGELNQHKDFHSSEHIRERAQKALSKIRKVFFGAAGRLNETVVIFCENTGPSLDMASRQLKPQSNDDCILAAVLEYQEGHPDEHVILVTDDPGFALRAHSYGVLPAEISAPFKIPAQADPKRKKIQELEQRIREAEKGLPRLSLAFVDGSDRVECVLQPETTPSIEQARAYVAANVAPQFPLQEMPNWRQLAAPDQPRLPDMAAAILEAAGTISQMMTTRRNAEISVYLEKFAQYVLASWKYANEKGRTHQLRMMVENTGSVPAEEVNLILRFPTTVSLFLDCKVPEAPKPPLPPGQTPPALAKKPAAAAIVAPAGVRLIRGFDAGDCLEVRYRIDKLNHHIDERFSLCTRLLSFEAAASFTIDYRIAAVNAPEPVKGSLHFIVKKTRPPRRRLPRPPSQ